MHLTICVACAHPANEHGAYGCLDVLDLGEDGSPTTCDCARSRVDVYRQYVPPAESAAVPSAREV